MTREAILTELRERASLPPVPMPPNMTPEQELLWLKMQIDQRRAEMGIGRFPTIQTPSKAASEASCSTAAR